MFSTFRIALISLLLLLPMQAQAGLPGAVLNENGYSEQAQNAADAAYNAVSGIATHGESVRGGSGPLAELALNSGSLICNSWIIAIRQNIQKLSVASASMGGDSPEYARTADALQKLNRLAEIIERECTEKKLIGIQPPSSGGVVGGSGGGTASSSGGGEDSGSSSGGDDGRIHPRDGETVADEICRRKCAELEAAMNRAERENERAQKEAQKTAGRAREAETARDNAQRDLTAKRAELRQLQANRPAPIRGSATNAQINEWTQYNRRIDALNRDIPDLESRLPGLRERATSARRVADSDAARAARTQAAYNAARVAYYECLRRCKSAAEAAGERTTLVVPGGGGSGRAVNKSATTPSKVKTVPNKRVTIELEDAVSVGGANAFNPKEIENIGRGGGKTEPVKVIAPPVVVQQPPVKPVTPITTPPVTPAIAVTTPTVPVAVQPEPKPEPIKEEPFDISHSGSVQFTHTVGSSSCPQDAGTVTISTSQAASIEGVDCSGAIASRLTTIPSGSGNQHTVKVLFNCSSADKGSYSGNVTVSVRSTKTGETKTISIPASGMVK